MEFRIGIVIDHEIIGATVTYSYLLYISESFIHYPSTIGTIDLFNYRTYFKQS